MAARCQLVSVKAQQMFQCNTTIRFFARKWEKQNDIIYEKGGKLYSLRFTLVFVSQSNR